MFTRALNPTKHSLKFNVRKVSTYVRSCVHNGIARIIMCNESTRNSLSIQMMEELMAKIKLFESAQSTRVIILEADTPISRVFSSGHNLKELSAEHGLEQQTKVFELASQLMYKIIDSPVPIIAKVDGVAAAAGCQLVAQCDLAFCSERSTFSTPGANFGIFCSTPGIALARCVPKTTAMKMLLTGWPIPAKEAEAKGLITKVSTDLDEDIKKVCAAISNKSRSVVELGKRFYYQQVDADVKEAYKMGAQVMVDNLNIDDGKEGIKSFVEKRRPAWKHQ